ncbi:hypothetical protein PHLGIDRAFT_69767, partial [Phlebiopsis gigantea 11061_1 CR5-6]
QLLYEVYMFSGWHSLPLASKHLYTVFKCAPSTVHAEYLLTRHADLQGRTRPTRSLFTRLLRNRLCTQTVLDIICRTHCISMTLHDNGKPVELPRRLFRTLQSRSANSWTLQDQPLPFLRYLYSHSRISPPDPNSHEGYALTKAVSVGFTPLVRFLLDKGASPDCKDGIAVHVAIRRRDLSLVKMLIEPDTTPKSAKKRRLEDRIKVDQAMLKTAIACDARDIVKYFMDEKAVMPDMQTLRHMSGR